MVNEGSKAYWQGYRDARIAGYLSILDRIGEISRDIEFGNDPYSAGFCSGLKTFAKELEKLLERENELKENEQE